MQTTQALVPYGFQLRHKEFGVFQGSCLGMGFWHPLSEMPEQSICRFPQYIDAWKYLNFLCSGRCAAPLQLSDLTIEVYDFSLEHALVLDSLFQFGGFNAN